MSLCLGVVDTAPDGPLTEISVADCAPAPLDTAPLGWLGLSLFTGTTASLEIGDPEFTAV